MASTFFWVPVPGVWYETSPTPGYGTPGPDDVADISGSYGGDLNVGYFVVGSSSLSGNITADEISAGDIIANADTLTATNEFLIGFGGTLTANTAALVGPSSQSTNGPFGNAGFENFGTVTLNSFSSIQSYTVDDFDLLTVNSGNITATNVTVGEAGASLDIESGGSISDTFGSVGLDESSVTATVNGGNWTSQALIIGQLGTVTFTVQNDGTVNATGGATVFSGEPPLSIGGRESDDVTNMTVTGPGSDVIVTGEIGAGWEATANITLTATAVMSSTGALVTGELDSTGVTNFDISNGGALLQVGGDATLSVLGITTVTLQAGGTMTVGGTLDAAQSGGSAATLVVSGGSLQISGDAKLGDGGAGSLTLDAGGTLDIAGTLDEGVQSGATGTLLINDASDSITLGSDWIIGDAGAHSDTIDADIRLTVPGTLTLGAQHGGAGSLDLDAQSASVTGDQDVVVGGAGSGSLNVAGGATLELFSGTLSLGVGAGGAGTLTAGGTGTRISVGKDVMIGNAGTGSVTLNQGATLDASGGALTLGAANGGSGTLSLGSDVTLTPGGSITVGNGGAGSVDLGAGATLDGSSGTVSLGLSNGGTGTISLSGDNSALNADVLQVGGAGAALISVAEGGTVSSMGDVTLGASNGGGGTITLAEGGVFSAGGNVIVGGGGSGTLTDMGGTLDLFGSLFSVGDQANGKGSVSLQDGSMAVTGSLEIGNGGTGSVGVHDSGTLTATAVVLGGQNGAQGSLSADDETASLQIGSMTIGNGGTGGVSMTGGAALQVTGAVIMGEGQLGSSSASAKMDSSISIGGQLDVGEASPASVTVASGGLVGALGGIVVGDQAGASGTITVMGTDTAPSRLSFGGLLEIGNLGTATLTVEQAGTAGTAGSGTVEIAAQGGATGSVTVTGTDSTLLANTLTVGGGTLAAGGHGTLSIASSGVVSVSAATIWANGTVTLDGGTLETDPVSVLGTLTGFGLVSGTIDNTGGIAASGGTLSLGGTVTGTGTMTITAGAGLRLKDGAAASQQIVFDAGGGVLRLDDIGAMGATIDGFAAGDTIRLDGVTADGAQVTGNTLVITDGGSTVDTLAISGSYDNQKFQVQTTGGTADVTYACYTAGTRIATPAGDIAVEHLRPGDRVTLARGGSAEVIWAGHRDVDCRRHRRPRDIWPIRVREGAFGDGMPRRDLLLSPDHAVFAQGVLVPVRYLVNPVTVVQERVAAVSYVHVELATHDVILAEGLPCETYLDTGNRSAFANGGPATMLHPDFARHIWDIRACAPLVLDGPDLVTLRRTLLDRATTLGHAVTGDAALHAVVDGRVVPPEITGRTHRFHLPPTARTVRLRSRSAVPAESRADSDDHRRLGVAVAGLRLDGRSLTLDDPRLSSGWHAAEPGDAENVASWRWTDGDAGLAIAGARRLEVDIAMTERYWLSPRRGPLAVARHDRKRRRTVS